MRLVVRSGTNLGRSSSAQLLVASKLRNLEPVGEGNREGADVFTRLTSLASKGSADDGKRSSLDVTFARGFPKGDNSTYSFDALVFYFTGQILIYVGAGPHHMF